MYFILKITFEEFCCITILGHCQVKAHILPTAVFENSEELSLLSIPQRFSILVRVLDCRLGRFNVIIFSSFFACSFVNVFPNFQSFDAKTWTFHCISCQNLYLFYSKLFFNLLWKLPLIFTTSFSNKFTFF